MKKIIIALTWAVLFVAFPVGAYGQTPPSYNKHIQPFFNKYCVECHNSKKPRLGLDLESYKTLKEGSDNGDVFTPGDPDDSKLVLMLEGVEEPRMPPEKSELQPKKKEIALVRAWVEAGGKLDKEVQKMVLPIVQSKVNVVPAISSVLYLPDGRLVASSNNHVLLIDTQDAKKTKIQRLAESKYRVTALATSKDGRRLAVADGAPGATANIRVFEIPTSGDLWPQPLSIAKAHDDVVHQLAFSPDGMRLASVGYDRKVKIWDSKSGKNIESLKEHSDSVYDVSFSFDGKLFATAAADRAVKVWEAKTGKLLYTLGESTDWLYAVAFSPNGKTVAAGGVDKSIRVWKVDAESGEVVHSLFAHQAPILKLIFTADGKTLYSLSEDQTIKAWDAKTMSEKRLYPKQDETVLSMALHPGGGKLALGRFDGALVILDTKTGKTETPSLPKAVKSVPAVKIGFMEKELNNSPGNGQPITWPATVAGKLAKAGDMDFFRFQAKAGQQFGAKVTVAKSKGKELFDSLLQLSDDNGRILAQSQKDYLGFTFTESGWYAFGIRDREFRGNPQMSYELRLGDVPIVTSIFPLGLQQGTKQTIRIEGVNIGSAGQVTVDAANAKFGSKLPVTLPKSKPLGMRQLIVGEFTEVEETSNAVVDIPTPGTANGVIAKSSEVDLWKFSAKQGQQLICEVNARRLGSDLDSTIEILDAGKKLVARATLRSLAQTYVTFRDHNNVQGNIRIEAWSELGVNDYIYVGNQLLRIDRLPTHPDSDCFFFTVKGQRVGYLDTTPTHVSNGEPMYKVAIHPPGTEFAPNGFPVVTLHYRNDDGGPDYGRDSRLFFDPPADGDYYVRISDTQGKGGSDYAYRLTVRPPRPSFNVRIAPANPSVSKGGAIPLTITADRVDGFNGLIQVTSANLPGGFSLPPTMILPDETTTKVALWAGPKAQTPKKQPAWKVIGEASIGGKTIRKEAAGGMIRAIEPGDLVTTTNKSEVTITPGGTAKLTLHIERRNGFKGRVPIDVDGMPHGVKVLDLGLNRILITEKETQRTIVFYCHSWVNPMEHPVVITANREGKNTKHAAKSVLLKIVPRKTQKVSGK